MHMKKGKTGSENFEELNIKEESVCWFKKLLILVI